MENDEHGQNQQEEVIGAQIDPSALEVSPETVRLDIFQHMRIGIKNKDSNCLCQNNNLESLYYCIPCKVSCCTKCTLSDHFNHLLLQKEKYSLKPPRIEASCEDIENVLEKEDLFKDLLKSRTDLLNEIDNTCKKIQKLVDDWKAKKYKEINGLFDDLVANVQEINTKKKNAKKLLNYFGEKHREFFGLYDKNKDPHNTVFLINYDLMSIPYMWSEHLSKLGRDIEDNMLDYKTREESKDREIVRKIREILFLFDDEDPITHEKIDEKFLPLVRLKVQIKDFTADKLNDLDKRINKLNKAIDTFKNSVLNSIRKHGNYKELSKENNMYEHRRVKGADNLFSQ